MRTKLFVLSLLTIFLVFNPIFLGDSCESQETKVLNNFVTELLSVTNQNKTNAQYTFSDQRSGKNWIYISSTADIGSDGGLKIAIDSDSINDAIIVHKAKKEPALETMRFLQSGEHTISVWCDEGSSLKKLIVRAIPDLLYCGYETNPCIKEYGPYDLGFLEKYILKNINTIIVGYAGLTTDDEDVELFNKWKKEGKRLIRGGGAPGLWDHVNAPKSYDIWERALKKHSYIDGLIFDEFIPVSLIQEISIEENRPYSKRTEIQKRYDYWNEAINKLASINQYKDKMLYAWVGTDVYTDFGKGYESVMFRDNKSRNFIQSVMDLGYRISWERYLPEEILQSTEEAARDNLDSWLKVPMAAWKGAQPGIEKHMVMCQGLFPSPPSNMNHNPAVNYNVWTEMQINMIANDPVFSGIKGIMWWYAGNSDEESNRWGSKLFRHYCIEGKTEMLSKNPYELHHIVNPDFDEGTGGWTLKPAEKGSIERKSYEEYGMLRSRTWGGIGDNFLLMKRSDKGPNVFSQEIKDLQPGKLYTMRMYTGDYRDLVNGNLSKYRTYGGPQPDEKTINEHKHAVTIIIEGADIDKDRSLQFPYATFDFHGVAKKAGFWLNYHWVLFRAKDDTAVLNVSDWKSEKEPIGPIDQELMYNFIEIMPYLE